jgi:hypothetical protein
MRIENGFDDSLSDIVKYALANDVCTGTYRKSKLQLIESKFKAIKFDKNSVLI